MESWSSVNAAMSFEEYDNMSQLLGSYVTSSELDYNVNCAPESMFQLSHNPQCDSSTPLEFLFSEDQVTTPSPQVQVVPSHSFGDDFPNSSAIFLEPVVPPVQHWQLKRKSDAIEDGKTTSTSLQVRDSAKEGRAKRIQKSYCTNDEEQSNATSNERSSSCCNSEDNSDGKSRGTRDLQILYARKRRERINERLRILQNLVPNGTKVDISTMLEEAVKYVKFLQLQIKLLSSDELWMYAPIAYNGINVGFNLKI